MLQNEGHRVPITALAFSDKYLFAGEGQFLNVYDRSNDVALCTLKAFASQSIHGIAVHDTFIFVWGGPLVSVYQLTPDSHTPTLISVLEAPDWILDLCVSPHHGNGHELQAVLITAHNALLLLRVPEHAAERASLVDLTSGSRCILYSAHLHWLGPDHVLVASGTVFGEIIIWSCQLQEDQRVAASTLHHVLNGHDGSIFGVCISETQDGGDSTMSPQRLLASCSDDRTVRIWDISELPEAKNSLKLATGLGTARETGFGANIADVLPDQAGSVGRCIARAYGHASRIWAVRFLSSSMSDPSPTLVSFGEDATYQYWRLLPRPDTRDFELVHLDTSAVHSGKHIWSQDLVQTASTLTVASGGANGSIVIEERGLPLVRKSDGFQTWSIDQISAACPPPAPRKDKIRSYAFANQTDLVVSTDSGSVLLLKPEAASEAQRWELISQEPRLRGYSVLNSLPELGLVFMAGLDGTVLVFTASSNSPPYPLVQCVGKTAALFSHAITTSGDADGTLVCLLVTSVETNSATLAVLKLPHLHDASSAITVARKCEIELPAGFIVTSATTAPTVTTDRETMVLVLGSRSGAVAVYTLDSSDNDRCAPAVHNYCLEGAHGKDAVTAFTWHNDSNFMSVGRDGSFVVHRVSRNASGIELDLVNRTVFALGTVLEGLHSDAASGRVLVWGFHSKQFVLIETTSEMKIMAVDCGGANRIWRFGLSPSGDGGVFAWTKASQLCLTVQDRSSYRYVHAGGHGREIKTLAVRPHVDALVKPNQTIFATGSEDTDIKIFSYDGASSQFRCLRTLRKHNTGIQHLQWSKDGRFLFSSGGFEELHVWRVQAVPVIGIGIVCESACPTESDLPDLRIMGFYVEQKQGAEQQADVFHISVVRSDSTVRIYEHTTSPRENEWQLVMAGNYLTSCLTQCLHLGSGLSSLITAGTDGHVAFWPMRITPSLEYSISDPEAIVWTTRRKIHQNAIHTMQLHYLAGIDDYLLLTAGDDNAIGITRFRRAAAVDGTAPITTTTVLIPRAHAAAITGLDVLPGSSPLSFTLASSGIDQRLKLWAVSVDVEKPDTEAVTVRNLRNAFTPVADVSSLAVVRQAAQDAQILVCGVGMEVWKHTG